MNWKLPNKELPSKDGFYLITCFDQSSKQNKTFVGYWLEGRFYLPEYAYRKYQKQNFRLWTVDIIAWSELPEPFNK